MTSTSPPLASADMSTAPDWERIAHEVKCPLCDYNLRGLNEPRCPECGYRFTWGAILDPTHRLHPYLFEHHPERNIRSYLQTLLHHLLPIRFWKTLDPSHRLRPARLAVYWAVYGLMAFLPAIAALFGAVRYRLSLGRTIYWSRPTAYYLKIIEHAVGSKEGFSVAFTSLLLALFPWLNFLVLMIFQQSMRRAKIKPAHVLRCTLYCGDVMFWYGLAAASAILYMPAIPRSLQTQQLMLWLMLGLLLAGLLNAVRLWTAYACYLKFKHALATVFASQIIVGLTVCTILICVSES